MFLMVILRPVIFKRLWQFMVIQLTNLHFIFVAHHDDTCIKSNKIININAY